MNQLPGQDLHNNVYVVIYNLILAVNVFFFFFFIILCFIITILLHEKHSINFYAHAVAIYI